MHVTEYYLDFLQGNTQEIDKAKEKIYNDYSSKELDYE